MNSVSFIFENILTDSSRNRSVHKMKNKTTCHIERDPREKTKGEQRCTT